MKNMVNHFFFLITKAIKIEIRTKSINLSTTV